MYFIKSTGKTVFCEILLQKLFSILIYFKVYFIPVMAKLEFSVAIITFFSVT